KSSGYIGKAPAANDYPVTYQQRAIWIICQEPEANSAYNMPLLLQVQGKLQVEALEKSIYDVIGRHEIFKTSFIERSNGEIKQRIENIDIKIERKNIDGYTEQQWTDLLRNESMLPFDLRKAPLVRVAIYQRNDQCLVLLVIHHIISDGVSLMLLKSELLSAYEARKKSKSPALPIFPVTYKDVAVWEQRQKNAGAWKNDEQYWRKILREETPLLQLVAGKRPPVKTYSGQRIHVDLPHEAMKQVEKYCTAKRVSFLSGLLAALNVLFYRYTSSRDLVVGTVTAGRNSSGLESIVGLFINTLAIRTAIDPDDLFEKFLHRQSKVLDEAFMHQEIPFAHLTELLNQRRDISRSTIFDIMVIYNDHRNGESAEDTASNISFVHYDPRPTSQFDITFLFHITDTNCWVDIEFNTGIYSKEIITRLADHYINIINSAITYPRLPVSQLSYLSEEEQQQLLLGFNDTEIKYETGISLVDLFQRQVSIRGNSTALKFGEQTFSYEELDYLSNKLAGYLIKKFSLTKDDLAGIMLKRGEWMIISILAVLKAGCAYVPIDPSYPEERIAYIKSDSQCKVCIDYSLIDSFLDSGYVFQPGDLPSGIHENNLAYVIYTSGSTGKPKGCMLEHKGIVNRLEWMWREYKFDYEDVILQKTTFTFDVSAWEIFLPLCWGCKMVLCKDEDIYSAENMTGLIAKHNVTCLHFVPGMFNAFIHAVTGSKKLKNELLSLKRVITSGEALMPETVKTWYAEFNIPVHNLYGPTEASIDVSHFTTKPGMNTILIGKPVANTSLYILDPKLNMLPIQVSGELYIGGVQLARGYLGRDELTKEKFISSPFNADEKLYRTGDLARWMPDGNIEYLGRVDDQVKIRGYRIEPGEIEHALLQLDGIKQAVVMVHEDNNGEKILVAYVISHRQQVVQDIKQQLRNLLPEYMVPGFVLQVSAFPLTASGKVDRKNLPPVDELRQDLREEYVAPRNETEEIITEAWQKVLNNKSISVRANFFETGGDSIKAIRLISQLKQLFKKEISIRNLYENNSIELLANYIQNVAPLNNDNLQLYEQTNRQLTLIEEEVMAAYPTPEVIEAVYPMSDIQKGMVFGSLANEELGVYHEQFIYQVSFDNFDADLFNSAFSLLVNKHETLRTSFNFTGFTQPVQIVWKTVPVKIYSTDICDHPKSDQENIVREFLLEERRRPFDFLKAPLWRIHLFRCSAHQIVYVLQFHHSILDGWSVATLNTELYQFYTNLQVNSNYVPEPLHCTNKDAIIENLVHSENEKNDNFWSKELDDYKRLDIFLHTPVLNRYHHSFPNHFIDRLKSVVKENDVSVKTLFFGVYLYALYMSTHEADLTIGLVGNNRPVKEDGDKLLGCFLNTVPARFIMPAADELTWREYIKAIDQKLKEIKKHDRTTLPDISRMTGELTNQGNPFFDVMFNYINFYVYEQIDERFLQPVLNLSQDHHALKVESHEVSNAWMVLDVHTTGNTLGITYTLTRPFKSGISLGDFHSYFINVLECCIDASGEKAGKHSILPSSVKQQLLVDFVNTKADYPVDTTVVGLFTEQVRQNPDSIALVCDNKNLTYQQLDEASNQLANYLLQKGIHEEMLVPVCLDRSIEMVVSILAILKTGAAYVPVDPDYPTERIKYMLSDTNAKMIVTWSGNNIHFDKELGIETILVDGDRPAITKQPSTVPVTRCKQDQLAYVLYTSGSTGKPKGVQVTHRNLANYLHWVRNAYLHDEVGNFALYSSVSFDLSVTSLFGSITNGKSLFIFSNSIPVDEVFQTCFNDLSEVDIIKLTPAHIVLLESLNLQCVNIKRVIAGGEALYKHHVEILHRINPGIEIINEYGPTEATVGCCVSRIHSINDDLNIGKPIDNCTVYIVDSRGFLQPVGVPGEIYLGGVQLARGYLNKEELTAEKFVTDSFKKAGRLYRTGDMGRWLPDGNIEYIGRVDEQVKIRGYRIEPGEIENTLLQLPSVTGAVITVHESESGQKQLIAYITSHEEQTAAQLRAALGKQLPDYMIPSFFVQVESFPLTTNGKIDKKKLPSPEEAGLSSGKEYVGARNEIEKALVEVYEDVLGRSDISIRESFFDLGGDSIKAILLINRLKQKGYAVKVGDVLKYPVIEELSAYVNTEVREVSQEEIEGEVILTPIQRWFLQSSYEHKHHYNQSVLLQSKKRIDVAKLEQSLHALTTHHDALRMVYNQQEGEWRQYNRGTKKVGYELKVYELREEREMAELSEKLQSSIDLQAGPLVKAALFQIENEDRLLLVVHHLVVDGVGWRILLEDLATAYEQLQKGEPIKLPLKSDAFRLWADKLYNYANNAAIANEKSYWLLQRQAVSEGLPVDFPAGSKRLSDSASQTIELSEELSQVLQTQVNRVYNTGINDILLTALGLAIENTFGRSQLLIELEGHGREELFDDIDTSRTVGWFTSMYPLLVRKEKKDTIIDYLVRVKEQLRKVPGNGIGYGLLKYLKNKSDDERMPELHTDITFNYLGDFGTARWGEFEYIDRYHGKEIDDNYEQQSKLTITGMMVSGQLKIVVGYSREQYRDVTIEKFVKNYNEQLTTLIGSLQQVDRTYVTPSDVTCTALSIDELKQLNETGDVEDIYELSPLQEGIYYHWLAEPGTTVYVEQLSYRIAGSPDIEKLQKSYEYLVDRHAVLRTFFTHEYGSRNLQIVMKSATADFRYEDVSDKTGKEQYINWYKEQDRKEGFDLKKGSQMRLTVLQADNSEYEFVWSYHHVLMDGWCISILINEFYRIYHHLINNESPGLDQLFPYVNYIKWLSLVEKQQRLQYWRKHLDGYENLAILPFKEKQQAASYILKEEQLELDNTRLSLIKTFCRKAGITESTFMQGAWGYLLSRYNNTNDVVFGSVVSGRPGELEGVETMIGLFINTIPVRVRFEEEMTVHEFLQVVQQEAIERLPHHYLRLTEIQSEHVLRNNLFDHPFAYLNYPMQSMLPENEKGKKGLGELKLLSSAIVNQPNYDFNIIISPTSNGLKVMFRYNGTCYSDQSIGQVRDHFDNVMRLFEEEGDRRLSALDHLSPKEKNQLLVGFNNTTAGYRHKSTIIDLFNEQANWVADRVALVHEGRQLTYRELDEQSNQLAHYLLQKGISKEMPVPVCFDRSVELIISILAILKAGAAYVPIDPAYPQERISYMLSDIGSPIILSLGYYSDLFEDELQLEKIYIDRDWWLIENMPKGSVQVSLDAHQLAYIIYTSGSTGKPKGVMIEHTSVVNLIYWHIERYDVSAFSRSTTMAGVGFDACALEIWSALLSGSRLYIVSEEIRLQSEQLLEFYRTNAITHAFVPPALIPGLVNSDQPEHLVLKYILIGGDRLPEVDIDRISYTLVNQYGPTECTVMVTDYPIYQKTGKMPPVGKPILNTHIYIVDSRGFLQPVGVPGEIYLGGVQLARGY
ncbi:MAG: amino acid adenylation domain-containing protein, partial [Chitinophagaceae bacterium]